MAATTNIRMKRIEAEYRSARAAQDQVLANGDPVLAQLYHLLALELQNGEKLRELNSMLDAIIEHLQVPYKPPMGFQKD